MLQDKRTELLDAYLRLRVCECVSSQPSNSVSFYWPVKCTVLQCSAHCGLNRWVWTAIKHITWCYV